MLLRPYSLSRPPSLLRLISTTRSLPQKINLNRLPPRPILPETEITEAFLKGSGPGGQKINKTSSAVQLKHLPTGIVVKCQATRSRSHNRKVARELLAERLEVMEKGEQSRAMLKGEVKRRRKASSGKKARRKYRALGEMGEEEEEGGENGSERVGGVSETEMYEEETREQRDAFADRAISAIDGG